MAKFFSTGEAGLERDFRQLDKSTSIDDMRIEATALCLVVCFANTVSAASKEIGNGFIDHGVASPMSNHRGIVATVDGDGRNVVLAWLFDHRGGYALLMIDAETGKSEQFPMPFAPGDAPYASILSSGNRFYTHFNNYFVEFDPVKRAFTFDRRTAPQMAMSMTEDDRGVIWSVTYPQSGVASFDPKTRAFKDYGHVYKENWPQYQRWMAADDAGWIYFAVGNTASQIIAFDPVAAKATPLLPDAQRKTGSAYVFRDLNGKVYGQSLRTDAGKWYELHKGSARQIERPASSKPKLYISDSQALFHRDFPDGKRLKTCDLLARELAVEDPKTGKVSNVRFDYTSEGAGIMGVAAASDGTISGGTMFPMRFFSFDPKNDSWKNRKAYGQFNTVTPAGDRFFAGGYPGGFLLEWDPAKPWVDTVKGKDDTNPRFLTAVSPTIHRPHKLLAHPDGRTIILAGTPEYGHTGGGLLFWDRQSGQQRLLTHEQILPQHSTASLVGLPDGQLLGGTTTEAGTGGEKKATQAELYIMDLATKTIAWHEPLFPGAQRYTDLCNAPSGLIYGIADRKKFFVFDPVKRAVVHEQDCESALGLSAHGQGPRIFVRGPSDQIYMVFVKGIVRINPADYALKLVAESPVPLEAGGDYLDGRLYFTSGSHLLSCPLPE